MYEHLKSYLDCKDQRQGNQTLLTSRQMVHLASLTGTSERNLDSNANELLHSVLNTSRLRRRVLTLLELDQLKIKRNHHLDLIQNVHDKIGSTIRNESVKNLTEVLGNLFERQLQSLVTTILQNINQSFDGLKLSHSNSLRKEMNSLVRCFSTRQHSWSVPPSGSSLEQTDQAPSC